MKKGIVAEMPDRLDSDDRCFDVKFTALGLAVIANVLSSSNQ